MEKIKYSKKRIGPIVEKYHIDTESVSFTTLIDLFSDSIDYQVWALKTFFGGGLHERYLESYKIVKKFIDAKQHLIKRLPKQNIMRYSESTIGELFNDISRCEKFFEIKKFVDLLNTDQRNIVYSEIFRCERGEWPGEYESLFETYHDLFGAIERINMFPEDKRINIITLASAIRDAKELESFIIRSSRDSYEWTKESLLSFIESTDAECEVVFDKENIVVVEVKGYRTCDLLCGGGRTSWCITRAERFYNSYVTDKIGAKQFLVFNFGVEEFFDLAHVGFTVSPCGEITNAHTTSNINIVGRTRIDGVETDINKVLYEFGVPVDVYCKVEKPDFEWSIVGFLKYLDENGVKAKIVWENGSAVCVETATRRALDDVTRFALVNMDRLCDESDCSKNYTILDFSVPYDNTESVVISKYNIDEWGVPSISCSYNSYNKKASWFEHLKKIGLSERDIIGDCNIDTTKLLHKYISDGNEEAVEELLSQDDASLDVNFEHDFQKPVFRAIDKRMIRAFKAIVNHSSFDKNCVDVFDCPVLVALVEEFNEFDSKYDSETEHSFIVNAIKFAIDCGKFDIDQVDCNGDTPLHIAACNDEAQWIIKKLVEKGADLSALNTDLRLTPLGMAERAESSDEIIANCKENIKFLKKLVKGQEIKDVTSEQKKDNSAKQKELIDILSKRAKYRTILTTSTYPSSITYSDGTIYSD